MEPLLPKAGKGELAELTCDILKESGRLIGQVHSPLVRQRIADLVRQMNCYYSNLIEGHKTTPREIERALRQDLSSSRKQRDNQVLSLAHIEVEKEMERRLATETVDVYSPELLQWLHREFYRRLPDRLHHAKTTEGELYRTRPGELRDYMVNVGSHTPPLPQTLPAFLERVRVVYGNDAIPATDRLIAIAAAHHRQAWIHPFGDGNGRVIRLHSHALLIQHGLDGEGLWTLSRGLARHRQRYYRSLQEADQPRRNDLDGRGNLTDRGLAAFCRFFLETVSDQVRFMAGILALPTLRDRVERFFQFEMPHLDRSSESLMRIVRTLVDEGEIPRYRVLEITGKRATAAARLIRLGLEEGLFTSPTPKGPLQIAFPAKVLESYFPKLYLDLPVDDPAPEED
jgi:Fic family protein